MTPLLDVQLLGQHPIMLFEITTVTICAKLARFRYSHNVFWRDITVHNAKKCFYFLAESNGLRDWFPAAMCGKFNLFQPFSTFSHQNQKMLAMTGKSLPTKVPKGLSRFVKLENFFIFSAPR